MSYDIELLVYLKVPDVTALTARHALQHRLGYADVLADLRRADCWRLTLPTADPEAAAELARELADKTTLFVNPNKHRYELRPVSSQETEARVGNGAFTVEVLVRPVEDTAGPAALQALREQYGYGDRVHKVQAGTLWILKIRAPGRDEARRLAEEITCTRSRTQGLLVNPHYQEYAVKA